MRKDFDVIVVGGGHAGIEASLAASRLGCRTLMITARLSRIGEMSCNPAIGGIAKGTIVREVDALDGSMAKAADATSLQFRMLNRRKGPAVWGPRVQSNAGDYAAYQQKALAGSSVGVLEDEVIRLDGGNDAVRGVICRRSGHIAGLSVVIAAGTFLRGRLFRGDEYWRGGRTGDISSDSLEEDLVARMFHVERFKTGTPARVLRSSVDTGAMEIEQSEEIGYRFSYDGSELSSRRDPCYTVQTNSRTAQAAKDYLHLSPLMAGRIEGTGPRYCPSFEDKVVKFPDRHHHRIYVEPMGYGSRFYYLNGLSTSLPRVAQEKMIRSLPGFKGAVIARFGYAVEYSYFHNSEIENTLRLKRTGNVYAAGQICGTSGYEEAAGLGLIAGINAARESGGVEPIVLSRMESYLGVMIDDIVSKGIDEPYRIFSSRAENRLHIRQDNADRRMFGTAVRAGVLSKKKKERLLGRTEQAGAAERVLTTAVVDGDRLNVICRRSDVSSESIASLVPELGSLDRSVLESVMLDEKYCGYIDRNLRRYSARQHSSEISLKNIVSYMDIQEICWEAREVLERERPENMAQACMIPGVRPTDVNGLIIHLSKYCSTWNTAAD
ncbi:MAG: tRNA uridine-5-carboxymethylaminomethyl(34) synthesis enzyme MnmG [Candidatus Fermentibacteraceae bacterium]|nr:tRNA uridine-5-carboxymethylaminomethyl(34) synthesis enzyme MnmG [Candidatus Fermentibacteraceae bacterium]